jgi:hypothetical protein
MTPAEARFADDFRRLVGKRFLKEGAGMAGYRLVCGDADSFDTFRSELEDLKHEAIKLGAGHLAEPIRTEFLDYSLPRALLFWIADWSEKWARARLTADQVGAEVGRWNVRLIAWAKGVSVLPEDWEPPEEWKHGEPKNYTWPEDDGP